MSKYVRMIIAGILASNILGQLNLYTINEKENENEQM